jgi:hypothetical protein
MSSQPIDPDTRLQDLPSDELYELFVDAGAVMPWEVGRLRTDPRTLREVCAVCDLDLDEIVELLCLHLERRAGAAIAHAQQLGADGIDDA